MHIKCPYCNCDYDIRSNTLGEAIGNIELGYGWWLRCYKCHKKFWLSNTKVINFDLSPVKANKQEKIKQLETLVPKKTNKKKHKIKWNYIILLISAIASVSLCIYKRVAIQNFFNQKILNFIRKNETNLQLKNVSYRLYQNEGHNKIYLCGYIVNNTKSIMSFNYLRVFVTVSNNNANNNDTASNNITNNIIASWNIEPNVKNIIPGDKLFFASDVFINNFPPNFQVNISLM